MIFAYFVDLETSTVIETKEIYSVPRKGDILQFVCGEKYYRVTLVLYPYCQQAEIVKIGCKEIPDSQQFPEVELKGQNV